MKSTPCQSGHCNRSGLVEVDTALNLASTVALTSVLFGCVSLCLASVNACESFVFRVLLENECVVFNAEWSLLLCLTLELLLCVLSDNRRFLLCICQYVFRLILCGCYCIFVTVSCPGRCA